MATQSQVAFEQLVTRVFKGLLIGAEVLDIRAQLASEGVGETFITLAIRKAQGTYTRLQQPGRPSHDPNPCLDSRLLNK